MLAQLRGGLRKFLHHLVPDSGFHGQDRIRRDYGDVAGESGDIKVGFPVAANEVQRVFGFSGLRREGIGIDDVGDVWLGHEF